MKGSQTSFPKILLKCEISKEPPPCSFSVSLSDQTWTAGSACREEMSVREQGWHSGCAGASQTLDRGILEAVTVPVTALHVGDCQHCILSCCWAEGIWAPQDCAGWRRINESLGGELMRVCRAASEPLWLHLLPLAPWEEPTLLLKRFCERIFVFMVLWTFMRAGMPVASPQIAVALNSSSCYSS